jgi:hypothetical protein
MDREPLDQQGIVDAQHVDPVALPAPGVELIDEDVVVRAQCRRQRIALDAAATSALLRDGLGEAEWALTGHVVADILIIDECDLPDGEFHLDVEALTLSD